MLTAIVALAASAEVELLDPEFDVNENSLWGMRLHAKVTVHGMKGRDVQFIAFFYNSSDGSKNYGGQSGYCANDNHTCTWKTANSGWDDTEWSDLSLFLPYSALRHNAGKNNYKFSIMVRDVANNDKKLGESEYFVFNVTYENASTSQSQQSQSTQQSQPKVNQNSNVPSAGKATISSISFINEKREDRDFLKFTVYGEVQNLQGYECTVSVYLYDQNKQPVRATSSTPSRYQSTGGNLALSAEAFYPAGNRNTFTSTLHLPQREIVQALRGSNVEEFYLMAVLWCNGKQVGELMPESRMRYSFSTQSCTVCKGSAWAQCASCRGTGRVADGVENVQQWTGLGYATMPRMTYKTCSFCNGGGQKTCWNCENGTHYNYYLSTVGLPQNNNSNGGGGGSNVVIINGNNGGGGSSNIGSSSSQPTTCYSCGGSGRCRSCNGTGFSAYTDNGNCKTCYGNGRCPGCRGSGHY